MTNALKLIYRNFRKNLSINLINLGGISLSMAVVLMLAAYCYTELKSDAYHPDVENTYLLSCKHLGNVNVNMPAILCEYLNTNIPDIHQTVRISNTWNPPVIRHEDGKAFTTSLIFSDSGFFDLFKYRIVAGSIEGFFHEPGSIILMKKEAEKIFGSTAVIGESVMINNKHLATVRAIIEQTNYQSFLSFTVMLPMISKPNIQPDESEFTSWTNWNFQTFVRLHPDAIPDEVGAKAYGIVLDQSGEDDFDTETFDLLPIHEIYFSELDNGWMEHIILGNKKKVLILFLVAISIFVIAIINYINISSYNLQERLVQTGIFKIMGASRMQIFKNYIFESALIFIISIWLAIILAEIAKPWLSYYTGISFPEGILISLPAILMAITTAMVVGMISCLWPAIKHSASHPISNLKKEQRIHSGKGAVQGSLVIFQFSAAIILITFTLLVHKQIQFGSDNLGFNESNLVSIKLTSQLKKDILKDRLSQESGISGVSLNRFYPNSAFSSWYAELNSDGKIQEVSFTNMDADASFFELMGLQIVAGRVFNDSLTSDKNKIIVNETFIKKYGVEDLNTLKINDRFEAIGVVKDFHFKSKNQALGPLVIMNRGYASRCLVQINSRNFQELYSTFDRIKAICDELSPAFPVEIDFMDDAVSQMYHSEIQFRRTFTFFAASAIFISCLGILALSLFASQRRTKEIGIRKVNGAHTGDILSLLNKDFTKWVIIAFLLAIPTSYFAMNRWLQQFAYKTNISWWIFVLGGIMALLIALLTVSWQSYKAARRNPVEALRYE